MATATDWNNTANGKKTTDAWEYMENVIEVKTPQYTNDLTLIAQRPIGG